MTLTPTDADQTIMSALAVVSGSKENESFSRWTPSGHLQIVISNEAPALGFFETDKEFFVEMYEKNNGCLNFGQALEALKDGKRVARTGWNGKGMFIFLRPADELRIDFVVDKVKSIPQCVKDYYRQDLIDIDGNIIPADQISETDVVKFTEYLCLKAADGTIVNGWLASQTDMLSEDWCILD